MAFPRENSDDDRKMFAVSDIEILIRQPISQIAVYCLYGGSGRDIMAKDAQQHKMKILVATFFVSFLFFLQNAPLPLRATQPFLLFTLFCLVAKENLVNTFRQRVLLLKHTIIRIILYMQQSYSQNIQVKKGV